MEHRTVPNPPDRPYVPATQLGRAVNDLESAVSGIGKPRAMVPDPSRDFQQMTYERGIEELGNVVRHVYQDAVLRRCGRAIRDAWAIRDQHAATRAVRLLRARMLELEPPKVPPSIGAAVIQFRAGIRSSSFKLHDFSVECFRRGLNILVELVTMNPDKQLKWAGRVIRGNYEVIHRDPYAMRDVEEAVELLEKMVSPRR